MGTFLLSRWKASSGWGFPKGKINQTENEISCAIREVHQANQVFEETGFDVSMYIKPEDYVERMIKDQRIRLFILSIKEQTEFETQTRKEIGDIKWHSINSLPGFRNRKISENNVYTNNKQYKYYMVTPFVPALRKWIQKTKKLRNEGKQRRSAALKVIMDTVEGGDSGTEDSDDNIPRQAVHPPVYLENSLKNLLGLTQHYSSKEIAQYAPDYTDQQDRKNSLNNLVTKEKETLLDILLKPKEPVLPRSSSGEYSESVTSRSESVKGRKENNKKTQKQKQIEQTDNLLKLLIKRDSLDSGLNERLNGNVKKGRKSLMDILEGVPMPPGPKTVFGKSVNSPIDIDENIIPSPQVKSNQKVQEENELLELLVSPQIPVKKQGKAGENELLELLVSPKVESKKEKIVHQTNELLDLFVGQNAKITKDKKGNDLTVSSKAPTKILMNPKKQIKAKKEEKIADESLTSSNLDKTPIGTIKSNASDELLNLLLLPKEKPVLSGTLSEPQGLGLNISNAGGLMDVLTVSSPQVVTSGQKKEKEKENGLLSLLLGSSRSVAPRISMENDL